MRYKINYKIMLFSALIFWGSFLNSTGSIDGTSSIQYLTTNQVLRDGQYARGFVKLNSGATILGDATVSFDITEPISGGLDLREAGVISLDGNLYLDSIFTITSNGVIRGNGNIIFMGGDLTLSDSNYVRILHINSDTVIDGCGHSLIMGRHAKMFIDDNVTLTLRNIIIKPTFNCRADPCIKLASNRSKLALDNVKFDLAQDFDFTAGQLFVHNDVAITGTSTFVYSSSQPSFITSGATLYFDLGATFFVAPSTFTDCRFDQWPTSTSNNFIKMADQTSQLYLNGCNLNATFTGCRFTKGTVNFENNVILRSNIAQTIDDTSLTYLGNSATSYISASIDWSPNGKFIIVDKAGFSYPNSGFEIFSFGVIGNPILEGYQNIGQSVSSVKWSPDGRFIAAVGANSDSLYIFSFSGSGNSNFVGSCSTFARPICVRWSPDGRFIAVTNDNDDRVQIFSFDGISNPTLAFSQSTGDVSGIRVANWSPDGKFIATLYFNLGTLRIFSFSESGLTPIGSCNAGSWTNSSNWSPDGRYIAVSDYNGGCLRIFSFKGYGDPLLIGTSSPGASSQPMDACWDPSGKYVVVCSASTFEVYLIDPVGQPHLVVRSMNLGTTIRGASWSPDGQIIAALKQEAPSTIYMFGVNYVTDYLPQIMTNSIVFGDSAKGVTYDPTVNILGNAYVENYGLVNYDCVN